MLKPLILAVTLTLATPVAAQDATDGEGLNLMEEAMKLFMRGLLAEMEPAITELTELLDQIDRYHPPEVLPNGDILIRRKTEEELALEEDGEIEL